MLSNEKMRWFDGLAAAGLDTDIITVGRCNWRELMATLHELQARVAELETKCDRCGLKLAHESEPAKLIFTPGELVYVPATVRYYPSETPGEPDVKEITYP